MSKINVCAFVQAYARNIRYIVLFWHDNSYMIVCEMPQAFSERARNQYNITQKLNDMVARSWAHHINQMSFIEPANDRTETLGLENSSGFPFWVPFAFK